MWFLLSLGTAFGVGTADALVKKVSQKAAPITMAVVRAGWGTLFLLPLLFFANPPHDPVGFWTNVLMALPLEVAGSLMFHTGLNISPLSLTVPYMAFTPVFMLGLALVFLREAPTLMGCIGVFLVTAGAFWLQRVARTRSTDNPQRPWYHLEKGSLLVLGAAFVYALTSILAKRALIASSPLFFCPIYYLAVVVGLFPFFWRSAAPKKDVISRPGLFSSIGILEAGIFILQFHAFQQAQVAYVIAIKRLGLLLAVFYGRIFFNERGFKARLVGAFLMVTGAILIALA